MTAAFVGSIPTSPVSTLITQSAKISAKNLLDGDEDNTLSGEKIKEVEQTMANMINGISKALENSGTDYLNKLDL